MLYELVIAREVFQDLENILRDIYSVSQDKNVAESYVNEIQAAILSLSFLPKKHAIHHNDFLSKLEVRFLQVKKYTVFYRVNDEKYKIEIARILYSGKNFEDIF